MKTLIKQKISSIEANLELLKRKLAIKPDPLIDELNWRKIRPIAKKVRKSVYRKVYGR